MTSDERLPARKPGLVHLASVAAWIAIAAGAFQPFYLQIFRLDLSSLRSRWTELPYRKAPGLRPALVEVARRTPEGAGILLWTPSTSWDDGYDYAYRRAQYLLAGRTVIPMFVDPHGIDARNPAAAQFIACWSQCPSVPPGFALEWSGDSGMLLRRAP